MKHPELWTADDKAELAEIERGVKEAKERRKRLFARIRQRAWRQRSD